MSGASETSEVEWLWDSMSPCILFKLINPHEVGQKFKAAGLKQSFPFATLMVGFEKHASHSPCLPRLGTNTHLVWVICA